ncbi:hypothetical protein [Roseateles sp. P5_E4]
MQALESARLSLAEFRQRSGFAACRENPKPIKKDITDALKTVFWAFSLQARTGLASPRALERHFEPGTFRTNSEGEPFNNNKWRNYFAGRHVPTVVRDTVAARYAGANACLDSPLWAALTLRPLTRRQLEDLVLPLAPDIQAIVRRRGTDPRPPRFPGLTIDRGLADMLERRASFDALAAAVIMVRIAHVEGESAAAFDWGRRVLRILLMLSERLHDGGIARPLLELVEERVMALAWHDGARPGYPAGCFYQLALHYARGLRHMKDQPFSEMTEKQRHDAGQWFLDFAYRGDYYYAFNPVRVISEGTSARVDDRKFATPDIWLHTWALNMLAVGGHWKHPPDAVRSGKDLWASHYPGLSKIIAAKFTVNPAAQGDPLSRAASFPLTALSGKAE